MSIDDAAEDRFVARNVRTQSFIGLADHVRIGAWRWVADSRVAWCDTESASGAGMYARKPNPGALDGAQCTTVVSRDGGWSRVGCEGTYGYVCETPPENAGKTLDEIAERIRDDYRTGKPLISHVTFQKNRHVLDPFSAYDERFGMRPCVDSLQPDKTGSSKVLRNEELFAYHQLYRGVRLVTRGYTVSRDPVTKVVHSVTGVVEHDLSLDMEFVLSEPEAYAVALASIEESAEAFGTVLPQDALVFYPIREGRHPQWELGWSFYFQRPSEQAGTNVVVSAKSGRILYRTQRVLDAVPLR